MDDTTNLTMLMKPQRPIYIRVAQYYSLNLFPAVEEKLIFMGGARANALACPK
jgi:hypothetical protein